MNKLKIIKGREGIETVVKKQCVNFKGSWIFEREPTKILATGHVVNVVIKFKSQSTGHTTYETQMEKNW